MTLRRTWLHRVALTLAYCGPPAVLLPGCATDMLAWTERIAEKPRIDAPTNTPPQDDEATTRHVAPSPNSADAALRTAREMEAHGDDLAAIEQYERVRLGAPKRAGVAARLAVLYERQGNLERAGVEYARALQEDPRSAELWNDFAYYQFQRGELDEAESAARRALKLDAEHKRSWVTLGLILAERERYDEAYESFAHAVSPAAAHNNLGIILARQGKPDDARRELALAHELDPTLQQPPNMLKKLSDEYVRASRGLATNENSGAVFVNDSTPPVDLKVRHESDKPSARSPRLFAQRLGHPTSEPPQKE